MDILEDNNLFQQLGLIRKFEVEMNCTVDRFREIFQYKVGADDSLKELYYSKKNYKGTIKKNSFDMYKSLKVVDTGLSQFAVKGTYKEIENGILINTVVYFPIGAFILCFSILLFIIIILIVNLLISHPENIWTVLLTCGAIFTGTTLFFLISFRRGVIKLTKELKEEFVNWDK
jgi:hypothetical protein